MSRSEAGQIPFSFGRDALIRPLAEQARGSAFDYFLCFLLCLLIAVGVVIGQERALHWSLIPLFSCGLLIGVDGVRWLRGKFDLFDPVGIIGVIGFFFFYISPLLMIFYEFSFDYPVLPEDWRHWLGIMGIWNLIGLCLYRGVLYKMLSKAPAPPKVFFTFDTRIFGYMILITLVITLVLQAYVYVRAGGIRGYMEAAFDKEKAELYFRGTGWIAMIAESFPILMMFAYLYFLRSKPKIRKMWVILFLLLGLFLVVRIFFGGLRGSRSNTVWGLFWALGILHLGVRKVSKTMAFSGVLVLMVFMYFYTYFKFYGVQAVDALSDENLRMELQERRERKGGIIDILIGDLSRCDIQAYLHFRLSDPAHEYRYALGRTYLGSLVLLWPYQLWPPFFPERPEGKLREGTELQFGAGTYVPGEVFSSKVYGFSGEIMMNFGIYFMPFGFLLWAWLVGWITRWGRSLQQGDIRLFFLPILINLCFVILVSDSDNIIFFTIKNGALPALVIWVGARRIRLTK
jgi:hypothetical protein